MPSTLTFPSTEGFRNKLLSRNLSPYTVPGSYTPPSGQIVQETIQLLNLFTQILIFLKV